MISVNHISKSYGDFVAVDDISFDISPGHIYGFLGPNGAGKSTTLNIIAGCLAADSGSVEISGYDIYTDPINAKKKIGFLPEIPPLYKDMTPTEYLSFIAEAKGVPVGNIEEHIEKIMSETGILDVSNKLISTLSKGFCQRVGIASAMISYPDIIILDEPTVGLDPSQIIEIRELILKLGQDHTIIFSSHILSEVSALCDEIIIINNGKILEKDTVSNIMEKYNESSKYSLIVSPDSDINSVISSLMKFENIITVYNDENKITIETSPEFKNDGTIISSLVSSGVSIIEFTQDEKSLEEIFISLTSGDNMILDNEINEDNSEAPDSEENDVDSDEDYSELFSEETESDESEVNEDENNL